MEQYYCRQCHRKRPADHFDQPGHYTTEDMYDEEEEEAPARPRRASRPAEDEMPGGSLGELWGSLSTGQKIGGGIAGALIGGAILWAVFRGASDEQGPYGGV